MGGFIQEATFCSSSLNVSCRCETVTKNKEKTRFRSDRCSPSPFLKQRQKTDWFNEAVQLETADEEAWNVERRSDISDRHIY